MKVMKERGAFAPTLHSAFQPVEQLWDMARTPGCVRGAPPLQPVDAMLLHTLLDMVPGRSVVVDLTTDLTQGAGSILALSHPRVRRVLAKGYSHRWNSEDWSSRLEQLRRQAELEAPLQGLPATVLGEGTCTELTSLAAEPSLLVLLAGSPGQGEQLTGSVGRCLQACPQAVVLLLGLGRVGECDTLDALLAQHGIRSQHRLHLLRERGAVLGGSTLGLVAHADHPVQEVLRRIEQMYVSNLNLLELLTQRNLRAIRAAGSDGAAALVHPLVRTLEQQVADMKLALKEATARQGPLWPAQTLTQLIRRSVAPDGTLRHRCLRLCRRAGQTLVSEGFVSVCTKTARKVARKVNPRLASPANPSDSEEDRD